MFLAFLHGCRVRYFGILAQVDFRTQCHPPSSALALSPSTNMPIHLPNEKQIYQPLWYNVIMIVLSWLSRDLYQSLSFNWNKSSDWQPPPHPNSKNLAASAFCERWIESSSIHQDSLPLKGSLVNEWHWYFNRVFRTETSNVNKDFVFGKDISWLLNLF